MFIHKVVIIRPDTTHDFYYNVSGVLNDPYYISLANQAKLDGKMLSEELTISDDQCILERTVQWDSAESFNEFFAAWLIHAPNHKSDLQNYSMSVDHVAMLVSE